MYPTSGLDLTDYHPLFGLLCCLGRGVGVLFISRKTPLLVLSNTMEVPEPLARPGSRLGVAEILVQADLRVLLLRSFRVCWDGLVQGNRRGAGGHRPRVALVHSQDPGGVRAHLWRPALAWDGVVQHSLGGGHGLEGGMDVMRDQGVRGCQSWD